jgi:hypothetical protein
VKQGLGPSVACVCVCAERRRHDHGSGTKLMACTRPGTRKGKTTRNGPAALGGDIRRRTTSRVHECACTGSARKDRASIRCWCVRAKGRRQSRGDGTMLTIRTRQRDRNMVTANGEVLTTRVRVHTTPSPRKAGPSLDGGVLSVWVPTASRNSACARRDKGTTRLQGKGARAATTAAAPAKRPARLDDRLSSDGGSARRRDAGQQATHKQRAYKARSSLGSKAGSTTR